MAKKNITIRVRESCGGYWFDIVLCEDNKPLMLTYAKFWKTEKAAIRNAKALAERIGIKYSDEVYKTHGC